MSDFPQAPGWWMGTDGKWYPPAVPAARSSNVSLRPSIFAVMGGAAFVLIGSFLPWIKLTAAFVGTVTKSGTEGSDGWFTVAFAVVAIILSWPLFSGRRLPRLNAAGVTLMGLGALGVGIWDLADILNRLNDIESEGAAAGAVASVGVGMWLVLAGAGAVVVGGLMEWVRSAGALAVETRAAPPQPPPPPPPPSPPPPPTPF